MHHVNLSKYCFTHEKECMKSAGKLNCDMSDTIIFEPSILVNLPPLINEIIVNAWVDRSASLILNKCKLPFNLNLLLNLKSNRPEKSVMLYKIILPEGVDSFTIKSDKTIEISPELVEYVKTKTKLIINNVIY